MQTGKLRCLRLETVHVILSRASTSPELNVIKGNLLLQPGPTLNAHNRETGPSQCGRLLNDSASNE